MSGSGMARDRDVAAFGERAQGYDEGWRGRMHHQIADATADLALSCVPAPGGYSTSDAGPATCLAGLLPAPRRRRS
jgi:hypothetical protein